MHHPRAPGSHPRVSHDVILAEAGIALIRGNEISMKPSRHTQGAGLNSRLSDHREAAGRPFNAPDIDFLTSIVDSSQLHFNPHHGRSGN
jgi:hypothetical protein